MQANDTAIGFGKKLDLIFHACVPASYKCNGFLRMVKTPIYKVMNSALSTALCKKERLTSAYDGGVQEHWSEDSRISYLKP